MGGARAVGFEQTVWWGVGGCSAQQADRAADRRPRAVRGTAGGALQHQPPKALVPEQGSRGRLTADGQEVPRARAHDARQQRRQHRRGARQGGRHRRAAGREVEVLAGGLGGRDDVERGSGIEAVPPKPQEDGACGGGGSRRAGARRGLQRKPRAPGLCGPALSHHLDRKPEPGPEPRPGPRPEARAQPWAAAHPARPASPSGRARPRAPPGS